MNFCREQVQAQAGCAVGLSFLRVLPREVSENLANLLIRDAAIADKPVPRAYFRQVQFLKATHHRLAGDAKEMRQDNHVSPSQLGGARSDFAKLLHDCARGSKQRSPECMCIAFFTRVIYFIELKNFRLSSGGR